MSAINAEHVGELDKHNNLSRGLAWLADYDHYADRVAANVRSIDSQLGNSR